jgi:hypothetical protein
MLATCEQYEQSEQSEQYEQPEQPEQYEQSEQPEQSEQCEQCEQYEQYEQSEQCEQCEQCKQYKQSEQPEQFAQREQPEQREQSLQSEQSEQCEQLMQFRQPLRLSRAAWAASGEPKCATLQRLPFASVSHSGALPSPTTVSAIPVSRTAGRGASSMGRSVSSFTPDVKRAYAKRQNIFVVRCSTTNPGLRKSLFRAS